MGLIKIKLDAIQTHFLKMSLDEKDNKTESIKYKQFVIFDILQKDDHINIWCHDYITHDPTLIRVYNFYPRFFLVLKGKFKITALDVEDIMKFIGKKFENTIKAAIPMLQEKLYDGYPRIKHACICLQFDTVQNMRKASFAFKYSRKVSSGNEISFEVHETKIDNITKFTTDRNIQKASGIQFPENKCTEIKDETTCKAYKVKQQDISGFEPSMSNPIHPSIASYDIETYSTNHNKMPNKNELTDVMYLISVVYRDRQRKVTTYVLLIGTSPSIREGILIKCDDEVDLITKFFELMKKLDPDVITGYNILSYDYQYVMSRFDLHNLDKFCTGRVLNQKDRFYTKEWESGAYGKNTICNIEMEGRIVIDLLPYVKRNYRLRKYTLDVVSKNFLKKSKIPVTAKEMFATYEMFFGFYSVDSIRKCIDEYVNIRNMFPDDEKKRDIVTIERLTPLVHQIKDTEMECRPSQRINLITESVERYLTMITYVARDSVLVDELFDHFNIWAQTTAMANVVSVTVYEVNTRGQQCRVFNQIYKKARNRGIIINKIDNKRGYVEGGSVADPIPGLQRRVLCVDFNSLYPNIVSLMNTCYTTLIDESRGKDIPDSDCNVYEDVVIDDGKEHKVRHRYYKHYKGILAEMCEELIAARKAVRTEMKKLPKGHPSLIIMDAQQNALKVSANSIFGFTGVSNGLLPHTPTFETITGKGRQSREFVVKSLVQKYGLISIYGDTDSAMMQIPNTDGKLSSKQMYDLSYEIEAYTNSILQAPLKVELEKFMDMICLHKKKYVYIPYKRDGSIDLSIQSFVRKGIMTARRDGCLFVYDMYDQLLLKVFQQKSFEHVVEFVFERIQTLLEKGDTIPIDKLSIVRKYSGAYKEDSKSEYFMKTFGDRLTLEGRPPAPEERLEYVIIDTGNEDEKLGNKMYLVEEYNERKDLEIDYMYYITNLMQNQIDDIVQICFGNSVKNPPSYIKPRCRTPIYLTTPVKFIVALLDNGFDLEEIKEKISV